MCLRGTHREGEKWSAEGPFLPPQLFSIFFLFLWAFPIVIKNLPAYAGDRGLIPGSGRSLEKEIATHSSILAWEIPWTEEPGGLQSVGSQRLGRDW